MFKLLERWEIMMVFQVEEKVIERRLISALADHLVTPANAAAGEMKGQRVQESKWRYIIHTPYNNHLKSKNCGGNTLLIFKCIIK